MAFLAFFFGGAARPPPVKGSDGPEAGAAGFDSGKGERVSAGPAGFFLVSVPLALTLNTFIPPHWRCIRFCSALLLPLPTGFWISRATSPIESRSGRITTRSYPLPLGVTVICTRPSASTVNATSRHLDGGRSMPERIAAVSLPMAEGLEGIHAGPPLRRHRSMAASSSLLSFPRCAAAREATGAALGLRGAWP